MTHEEILYRQLYECLRNFPLSGVSFEELFGNDNIHSVLKQFSDSMEYTEKAFTEISLSGEIDQSIKDVLNDKELTSLYVNFMYYYYSYLRNEMGDSQ